MRCLTSLIAMTIVCAVAVPAWAGPNSCYDVKPFPGLFSLSDSNPDHVVQANAKGELLTIPTHEGDITIVTPAGNRIPIWHPIEEGPNGEDVFWYPTRINSKRVVAGYRWESEARGLPTKSTDVFLLDSRRNKMTRGNLDEVIRNKGLWAIALNETGELAVCIGKDQEPKTSYVLNRKGAKPVIIAAKESVTSFCARKVLAGSRVIGDATFSDGKSAVVVVNSKGAVEKLNGTEIQYAFSPWDRYLVNDKGDYVTGADWDDGGDFAYLVSKKFSSPLRIAENAGPDNYLTGFFELSNDGTFVGSYEPGFGHEAPYIWQPPVGKNTAGTFIGFGPLLEARNIRFNQSHGITSAGEIVFEGYLGGEGSRPEAVYTIVRRKGKACDNGNLLQIPLQK